MNGMGEVLKKVIRVNLWCRESRFLGESKASLLKV